jgi:hypothetical protein
VRVCQSIHSAGQAIFRGPTVIGWAQVGPRLLNTSIKHLLYRRYRIVDERDIKKATERMQAHLAEQVKPQQPVIVPIIINPGISTVRK